MITAATFTATISTVAIVIESLEGLLYTVVANEARPATLADADTMLAFHGYGRTGEWDLGPHGTVTAQLKKVDNRFNGTVAARLEQAVGTTHEEFSLALAKEANDGDLITDAQGDFWPGYVVAGSCREGETMKIHMVGEGQTWEQRYTTHFPADQVVRIARRKA